MPLIAIVALLFSIGVALGLIFRRKNRKQGKEQAPQPEPLRPPGTRACFRCGKAIAPGAPVYHVYQQDQGGYDELLVFVCGECYPGGAKKPV